MAIGKPLLVTERQGVQDIVKSGQINPLSTQVAAQKLSFVDYNIGQDNSKAAFAVTDELINMGGALGKSAIYIAQTKNAHKKVQISEEFRGLQDSFNKSMAETNDLVGRENLYASYMGNMKSLSDSSSSSLMQDPESQQFMASMRAQSKNIGNTAFTKIESQRFTETKGSIEAGLALIKTDITSNPNADLKSSINKANSYLIELNKIGALSDSQLVPSQVANAQSYIVLKGGRMGKTHAENYEGIDYDNSEEAFNNFKNTLVSDGIPVTGATAQAFKDSYSKALAKAWNERVQEATASENYLKVVLREEVNESNGKFAAKIATGKIDAPAAYRHFAYLKNIGLYGELEKAKELYRKADKPITSVVSSFTSRDSENYLSLQEAAYPEMFGGKFYSEGVRDALRNNHGIYHEPTILKIIGDLASAGRGGAERFISGDGVTGAMQIFFLDKIKKKNVGSFMTEIGMTATEQEQIQMSDLVSAKNSKTIMTALAGSHGNISAIISKMKAMISSDGLTSKSDTPFANGKKIVDGKEITLSDWMDRSGTEQFRKDYEVYISQVFDRAKGELMRFKGIDTDDIQKQKNEENLAALDRTIKRMMSKKGFSGNPEEIMQAIKQWFKVN